MDAAEILALFSPYWKMAALTAAATGWYFDQRHRLKKIADDLIAFKEVVVKEFLDVTGELKALRQILTGPADSYKQNGLRGDVLRMDLGIEVIKGMYQDISKRLDTIERPKT